MFGAHWIEINIGHRGQQHAFVSQQLTLEAPLLKPPNDFVFGGRAARNLTL